MLWGRRWRRETTGLLTRLIVDQQYIIALLKKEGTQLADITQALTDLATSVQAAAAELTTLKADLDAAIAAGNSSQLQAVADSIEAQVTALNNAAAAAKPS